MPCMLPCKLHTMESRRAQYKDPTGAQTSVVSNSQGLQLYLRKWPAKGKVKVVLVAEHGWSFTARYFDGLANHLNKQGVSVYAHDLQGHGLSDAVYGLRGYARSLEDHVTDLDQILTLARDENPGVPVFLYAESMGGTFALQYARQCTHRQRATSEVPIIRGLILASPVIRVAKAVMPPAPLMLVLRLVSWIAPRLEIPDDSIKIVRDPDNLLTITRTRVGFAVSMLSVISQLGSHMEEITVPFLIMHGPKDTRTELCNSEELVRRSQATDKQLFSLPDMNHQLLQDKPEITNRVLQEMGAWIAERCKPAKT